MDAKTKMVKARLAVLLKQAQHTLDEWRTKKLDHDAAWAFEWAEGAMGAAAVLRLVPHMLQILDANGINALRDESIRQAVLGAARNYKGSRCADLMQRLETQTWAEVAEQFTRF